jgi:hypothetical protein
MASRFTTDELEVIAHGLGHYRESHRNLPLFKLPRYTCDDEMGPWVDEVEYADTREVFAELAELRRTTERS